jgi:hypothetical protein
MSVDKDQITKERDQALAENARLKARLELLKEAAVRALEHLNGPNPYADKEWQRKTAVAHLEDALEVNGQQVLRFEVWSDKN